jgi:hypothetical protein
MKQRVPFKRVFDQAQKQLRLKFGMEMIELPVKEKTTTKAKLGKISRFKVLPMLMFSSRAKDQRRQ